MGKTGPKPKGKVKVRWSTQFAYAIGLLASDGNLSPDGRHITFTSKDIELIELFQKALNLDMKVGQNVGGYLEGKRCFRIQFGDVLFYDFLLSIGLMPNKSKIIGKVSIPSRHFFSFLLGAFDGDGSTYSYFDPRWRSSFMFYTIFASASNAHIKWMQEEIYSQLKIKGHITTNKDHSIFQLKYAKSESLILLKKMYRTRSLPGLARKRLKIQEMLSIIGRRL